MTGVMLMVVVVMVGMSGSYGESYSDDIDDIIDTDKIVADVGGNVKTQLKFLRVHLDGKFTALTDKVEQLSQQLETDLEQVNDHVLRLQTQLNNVATKDDILNHKAKMITVMSTLAKEASVGVKIEEVMVAQLLRVTQKIDDVSLECSSCGKADRLAEVLDQTIYTQSNVTALSDQLEETSSTLTTSCAQGCDSVREKVDQLASERCAATTTLTGTVDNLKTTVDNIQHQLTEVVNYTRPPPPPPTLSPAEPGAMTPCEDSTFINGVSGFNVCRAAVQYQRCRVRMLSYHCCRSCTNSGQIPAEGPWRFYNYPRTVRRLQAQQLITAAENRGN